MLTYYYCSAKCQDLPGTTTTLKYTIFIPKTNLCSNLSFCLLLYPAYQTAFHPFLVGPEKHDWENKEIKNCIGNQPANHHDGQRF